MLFEYSQQPTFIHKYELIKQFFIQFQQVRQCEQSMHSVDSELPKKIQKETEESLKFDDSTSRQVPKQRRVVYITKKQEQRKSRDIIRPSDIMMIEQQKEKIDQFCKDNRILHDNNKECMYLIHKMAKMIKKLKSQSCQDHLQLIEQLQLKLKIKDAEIAKKNECIQQIREKYDKMIAIIQEHSTEEEQQWQELQNYQIELELENSHLKKALSINFTEEQIKQMEAQQNEVELQFFDDFCISRKELYKKAIVECDKLLEKRKQQIEQQYVELSTTQILQHYQNQDNNSFPMHKPMQDLYAEEKEMMMKKQSTISKEDKQRIMEDLLKPIGVAPTSEVKQKQLDILNNSNKTLPPPPKKLAIDIDAKDNNAEVVEEKQKQSEQQQQQQQSQQQKISQKQQILNSLNSGWQKLMQQGGGAQQNRYQDYEEEDDQVTYNVKNHMFTNAKTIVYDQDDYMDDEEEEEVYQQIFEQQKKLQKPTLTKTQKNQELQYQ